MRKERLRYIIYDCYRLVTHVYKKSVYMYCTCCARGTKALAWACSCNFQQHRAKVAQLARTHRVNAAPTSSP
eukprot:COSAG01_NODE_10546_length_2135_cov_1.374263_2_plen_72_part_00